jgi:hypothetical protein
MHSFPKYRLLMVVLTAVSIAFAQQVVGDMTANDASVKGSVVLAATGARLLSGSSVNAGNSAASVKLARGGELRICPHTGVAITTSQTGKDLQIALNTGAVETHYSIKTSADSILTPDFRILFPGPGTFHFAIAADARGNTCVRSLPGNASSLVVTEVLGDGIYQVQPTDQVYFRGGRVANADPFVPPDCGCGAPQPPVIRANTENPEVPTQPAQQMTTAPATTTANVPPPQPGAPAPQTVYPKAPPAAAGPAVVTQAPPRPVQPQPQPAKPAQKVDVGGVPANSPQALIAAYGNPVPQQPAPAQQPGPTPDVNSAHLQLDAPLVYSAESVIPPPPMTLSLQSMAPLNLSEAAILPEPKAPELQPRRANPAQTTVVVDEPQKKRGFFGSIGGFFSSLFGGGKKK